MTTEENSYYTFPVKTIIRKSLIKLNYNNEK
jgi:hypothetical protein